MIMSSRLGLLIAVLGLVSEPLGCWGYRMGAAAGTGAGVRGSEDVGAAQWRQFAFTPSRVVELNPQHVSGEGFSSSQSKELAKGLRAEGNSLNPPATDPSGLRSPHVELKAKGLRSPGGEKRASEGGKAASPLEVQAKQLGGAEGVQSSEKKEPVVVTNSGGFSWVPVGGPPEATKAKTLRNVPSDSTPQSNQMGFSWIPVSH